MEKAQGTGPPEETAGFMANVRSWLRDVPQEDGTEYEVCCEVLVIGAGQCGMTGTLAATEYMLSGGFGYPTVAAQNAASTVSDSVTASLCRAPPSS